MTDPVDPHQRSKDETINIALIHHHVNSNTPSGVKIRQAFPFIPTFDSTVKSGANRSIHHDLQIQFPESGSNVLKTVEFKGSQYFKPIDNSKPPWFNGVQFYNGTGSKLSIGHKYARDFYDIALDEIIQGLNIQTPKPTYEVWVKDAFRQGRPSTPFVCEIREKGYDTILSLGDLDLDGLNCQYAGIFGTYVMLQKICFLHWMRNFLSHCKSSRSWFDPQ